MRRPTSLAIALLVASTGAAAAQPSMVAPHPPSATPPSVPTPAAAAADTGVLPITENPTPAAGPATETPAARLFSEDAAADRAYLTPTGFTAPRGTTTIHAWTPAAPVFVLATASYAATDRIELAAGGASVLEDQGGSAGYVSAKVALVRRPTFGIAAQAQFVATGDETLSFFTGAASKCLDPRCRTVVTAHVSLLPISSMATDSASSTTLHVVAGGSLVTGGRLKLVVDGAVLDDSGSKGALVYAGARLAHRRWAVDAGLVGYGDGDRSDILPVPLVALAARF